MLYDTIEEYENEIQAVKATLRRIMESGQARSVGISGGNRSTNEAQLDMLRKHLSVLQSEKKALQAGIAGDSAIYIGASW